MDRLRNSTATRSAHERTASAENIPVQKQRTIQDIMQNVRGTLQSLANSKGTLTLEVPSPNSLGITSVHVDSPEALEKQLEQLSLETLNRMAAYLLPRSPVTPPDALATAGRQDALLPRL